jgi:hypothetical protein
MNSEFAPLVMNSKNALKSQAIHDFHWARARAVLEKLSGRLTGQAVNLLAYEEIARRLRITGRAARGLQTIPLEAIVGSVGRYSDFSRTFLPRLASDRDRWVSVKTAAPSVADLPPIEVYQVGECYFVLDGNHRVSIARQQGLAYIEAYVTEVRTRVPLSPGDSPDELIIKSEYAAFLEFTRLDQVRPAADLRVSVPGQYVHLENLIEVQRYFSETAEERELDDAEAVGRWYDEAYRPLVEAIREQEILEQFPGRTETDYYIWLATHCASLQNELGWQIRPQVAVAQLAAAVAPKPERRALRLYQAISDWRRPAQSEPDGKQWRQEKMLDRYSQQLFADILVLVKERETDGTPPALAQAQVIAEREQGQLCGLLVVAEERYLHTAAAEARRDAFCRQSQEAGLPGCLAVEAGRVCDRLRYWSRFTDLIVFGRPAGEGFTPPAYWHSILQDPPRPVLLAADRPSRLGRALLVYDDQARDDDGLFVAAYMGEQWGTSLIVWLPAGNAVARDHVQRYLALHEVEAMLVQGQLNHGLEPLLATAAEQEADLLILDHSSPHLTLPVLNRLLAGWDGPLLICP